MVGGGWTKGCETGLVEGLARVRRVGVALELFNATV